MCTVRRDKEGRMDYSRLTGRPPIAEEREVMYLRGLDPTQWLVLCRLNGIMAIRHRTNTAEIKELKMP